MVRSSVRFTLIVTGTIFTALFSTVATAIAVQLGMQAQGQFDIEIKITASDAAEGDNFGFSVAIAADTAIVGTRFNDDAGINSGSAYIFARNQGGTDNWGEVLKLTASDAAAGDSFGQSVAIADDTAIVGAGRTNDIASESGSAYIFARNQGGADNWGEVSKLKASDAAAADLFGTSVSISGDTAIVGAHQNRDAGSLSGSAYIFARNQGGIDNWGQLLKLTASDAAAGDRFGISVAISGDTVIVGAFRDQDNSGIMHGSAYIFARNQGGADNWGEVMKVIASDPAHLDGFGVRVAISGDTAIAGAFENDDDGSDSGSAYIFARNQGGSDNWGQVVKLTASDAATEDFFGHRVGISGDTAIVGAFQNDDDGSNSGSAYTFVSEPPPQRFVRADIPISGDGTSWGQAYGTLQEALIDAAGAGGGVSEIWVAAGTYTPDDQSCTVSGDCTANGGGTCPAGVCVWSTPRAQTFQLLNGVALFGGFTGTETLRSQRDVDINVTILTGDLNNNDGPDFANYSDNSFHVVTASGTNITAILDGFTVRAGSADSSIFPHFLGGGILADIGSPIIRDCTLEANRAEFGGGLFAQFSTALIDDCLVTGNRADSFTGQQGGAQGGGLVIDIDSNVTIINTRFIANTAFNDGAGMSAFRCTVTLTDCWFEGNIASGSTDPGGAALQVFQSAYTATRCTFLNNTATSFWGGAIINEEIVSASLVDCVFDGNTAGFGPNGSGGAVLNLLLTGPVEFINCSFIGNSARLGGAVYNWTSSPAEFWNCKFAGNIAQDGGGAVRNFESGSPRFTNCLFSGNTTGTDGGALRNWDSIARLVNCTFSGNSASVAGGGVYNETNGSISLSNSILWQNDDAGGVDQSAQIDSDGSGTLAINYSSVQGWTGTLGGTGNIGSDPMFVDPDGLDDIAGNEDDDLRLLVPSPAIDAGNNAALPLDSADLDGDTIVVERLPLDLLGNLRLADIFTVDDTGNGIAPIVDMGALETFRECNDNGIDDAIDIADLTSLDCNGNGVPDECEIDLGGGAPGGPFFCSTGCDPDCNNNGIPDECDITDLTSTDCNSNGIPDECEPDCNGNGIVDQCDITSMFSTDCNGNGTPDKCEIDSGSVAPGGPFFCSVGCDPDCNDNGIPDACDISNCPAGTAACDDCDLSGVPDSCEVPAPGGTCTVGCLADSNGDGVPDKCAGFTGSGAMNDTLWSNADNWDIGGGTIPDNVGGSTFSVSANAPPPPPGELFAALAVTTIDLDLDVTIDSLRVGSGVLLNVQSTSADNLTIVTTGGLRNDGEIAMANDRVIDVFAGPVTIGAGGRIEADPLAGATNCAGGQVCAELLAGDLALVGSTSADCAALRGGGELNLRGDMSTTVSGNLIMAGSASNSCAALAGAAASSSAFRGITPSPKWRLIDRGSATMSGSIVLTDSAETTNTSTEGVLLGGSFDNKSTFPSVFDWSTGKLTMDGAAQQLFEVAGWEFGPFAEGFSTDQDTLFDTAFHTNYSIGTLVIETDADVTFENTFANTAGAGPCEEALYVNELVLEEGSTMRLRDVRVYYNTLVDNGSTRVFIGCGKLVEVTCTDNAVSDDCVGATTITDGITAFDNTCASVDGLSSIECETGGQRIGSDVWYRYTATCTGLMDVSLCGSADFDAGLSVFQDPLDPTLCPCPADTSTQDGLCADDTCGTVAGASEIERGVQQGDCYLIRMGGIVGDFGTGALEITCVPLGCTSSQSQPPAALQVEATGGGTGALTATRTLNFTIPNLGGLTSAVRIELKEIPANLLASNPPGNIPDSFLGLVGAQMWVGTDPNDTQALCSVPSVGFGGVCPPGVPTIQMTALSQTASMLDWSTQGELHIYGSTVGAGANFIIPGAVYEVTVLVEGCDPEDPASFSPPLTLAGPVPGDIVGVYDATSGVWTIPGDGASITTDVLALLQAFKGAATAPNKARMDIQGTNAAQRAQLDGIIGLNDVNDGIDGFKGRLYRFAPGLCTGGGEDGKRGCDPDDAGSKCIADGGACAFDCPAESCPNAP